MPDERESDRVPAGPEAIAVKKNWTKIEELGATFTTQFKKAQESRGRDKDAVDAANETYKELADLWAEVGYAALESGVEVERGKTGI